MKKMFYIGALSAMLLTACGEEDAALKEIAPESEQAEAKEPVSTDVKENKELTYYNDETKVYIDGFVKTFDDTWNNIWSITMKRAEANEISIQDAHSNLKKVQEAYRTLSMDNKIPKKQLSKNNKKLAEKIIENLNMAAVNRQAAAEIAIEILETNNTAKLNDMNEKIEWSNNFMATAQEALTELEANLSK